MNIRHHLRTLVFSASVLLFAATLRAEAEATPLEKARAARQHGDLAAAEALLTPMTTGASADAVACFELAQVRLQQRRPADAMSLLETATKADATKPEYFSLLGTVISQRMGEVSFVQQGILAGKMRKAFNKSLELDPNHIPGLIGLTRFYTNAPEIAGGSIEKATAFAERIRKINPALGEQELGQIAEHEEDYAKALTHYQAAGEQQPRNPWLKVCQGRVQAKLGHLDQAKAEYEAALTLDPKFEPARKALAALTAGK